MKIVSNELIPPPEAEATRRITLELTASRAEALANFLNDDITWDETPVEDELDALYCALKGY